jgi:hypothetical protein
MQNHLSPDLKRKIAFYLKSIIEKSRSQRIKIKKVNPFSNPMATYTVRLINAEKNQEFAYHQAVCRENVPFVSPSSLVVTWNNGNKNF